MKAIILAAGMGTRLRPYTLEKPKCLVEINGKSLLDYQIEILRHQGVKEIVLVGGYKAEMLKGKADRLYINNNYQKTNMVWSLFQVKNELKGDVIITYGDIVYSPEILGYLLKSDFQISVAIDKQWEGYWKERFQDPLMDAENLILDKNCKIKKIGGKAIKISNIQGQYIGLMKFREEGIKAMKECFLSLSNQHSAYMTDLIQTIIDRGFDVSGIEFDKPWIEVDSVKDLNLKITNSRLFEITKYLK